MDVTQHSRGQQEWIDSIAVSVFVVILVEFDKYWIWDEQACLLLEPALFSLRQSRRKEEKELLKELDDKDFILRLQFYELISILIRDDDARAWDAFGQKSFRWG